MSCALRFRVRGLNGRAQRQAQQAIASKLASSARTPLRPPYRSPSCVACGASPAITAATLPSYDYAAFTGQAAANDAAPAPLQLIPREERITPRELQQRWVLLCWLVVEDVWSVAV